MVLKHHSFFLLLGLLLLLLCLLFPSMSGIRVGSLNLNGARDIRKRALLFELIKQKGIDIALVQETHSDRANEVDWRKEWEGEVSFSHMCSTRGGVAVLFARRFLPISFVIEQVRSEARRVGQECVSTCRSRRSARYSINDIGIKYNV